MKSGGSIRAVVFDFDGTLVDSNRLKREAYDAAFRDVPGVGLHLEGALEAYQDRDRVFIVHQVVRQLVRSGVVGRAIAPRLGARALRRYARFCAATVTHAPDFPRVAATLRVLSARYLLAVNSGTQQVQLRRLVRRRNWGARCTIVLGSPSSKVANMARIARRFGLERHQMVLVGDSEMDAEASRAFGCPFIHAAYSGAPRVRRGHRLERFSDLPRVIARIERRRGRHVP